MMATASISNISIVPHAPKNAQTSGISIFCQLVISMGFAVPAVLKLVYPGVIDVPLLGTVDSNAPAYYIVALVQWVLGLLVAIGCYQKFVLPTCAAFISVGVIQSSAALYSGQPSCGCFGALQAPPYFGLFVGGLIVFSIMALWSNQAKGRMSACRAVFMAVAIICVSVATGMTVPKTEDSGGCSRAVRRYLAANSMLESDVIVVLARCGCVACDQRRHSVVNDVLHQRLLYPGASVIVLMFDCNGVERINYSIDGSMEIDVGREWDFTKCSTPQVLVTRLRDQAYRGQF